MIILSGLNYIVQTEDLARRIKEHNTGRSKSTAPYTPWEIRLVLEKSTRSEAMILGRKLKNLSKERMKKFIVKYL